MSNHTHYSPTDPDAKISTKPGKPRQLNYAGQLSVDDANHVITGACGSTAGSKDSAIFSEIMDQTIENLLQNDMKVEEVIADAGYSSGESLQYCEDKGIDAYIPNFGQYKPERKGFIYNGEKDQYECIQEGGNRAILPFKGERTDSKGYRKKTFRSSESDCKNCLLREQCCGKTTKFKKLDESVHKPLYDRMHKKLTDNKSYHRRLVKRRSSTVEPVLGTLIRTTNWIERLNRDFKRTTRMRGALLNPEATLLLLGGVARDVKAYRRKVPLLGKEEKKFQCQKKKQKNMYKFVVNKDRFYTLFGTLLKIIVDLNHRKRCLAANA